MLQSVLAALDCVQFVQIDRHLEYDYKCAQSVCHLSQAIQWLHCDQGAISLVRWYSWVNPDPAQHNMLQYSCEIQWGSLVPGRD